MNVGRGRGSRRAGERNNEGNFSPLLGRMDRPQYRSRESLSGKEYYEGKDSRREWDVSSDKSDGSKNTNTKKTSPQISTVKNVALPESPVDGTRGEGDSVNKKLNSHGSSITVVTSPSRVDKKFSETRGTDHLNLIDCSNQALMKKLIDMDRKLEKIDEVEVEMEEIKVRAGETDRDVEELKTQVDELDRRTRDTLEQVEYEMLPKIDNMRYNLYMETQIQEAIRRRPNMIIEGIPEGGQQEDTIAAVNGMLLNIMAVSGINVEFAQRLGFPSTQVSARARGILIRIPDWIQRGKIWKQQFLLRKPVNRAYSIRDDVPEDLRPVHRVLRKVCRTAKNDSTYKTQHPRVIDFGFSLNGLIYPHDDLESLPRDLRPSVLFTRWNDGTLVFHSYASPYSNHFICHIIYEGFTYFCVEQILAYERASFLQDECMMNRASTAKSPSECKRILKNLKEKAMATENYWTYYMTVLNKALLCKYSQNMNLLDILFKSGDKTIGEASTDLDWGTGLHLDHSDALKEEKWQGNNRMGIEIMAVRATLKDDFPERLRQVPMSQ